ncbi:MAG: Hsp20/alpha crystallin family protein [Rhodocyclales bacterium]|nr:Hsp20/alpha crystallin family protein [Rhodocyclales bacterium]
MNERQANPDTERKAQTLVLVPRVDVFEDVGGITLVADMAGVPKELLELHVEGDTLRLEGEIAADAPDKLEAVYAEVQHSRYRRAFALSPELDTSRIEAQFRDGVLNLRIPKHAHAQPRKIEVTVA